MNDLFKCNYNLKSKFKVFLLNSYDGEPNLDFLFFTKFDNLLSFLFKGMNYKFIVFYEWMDDCWKWCFAYVRYKDGSARQICNTKAAFIRGECDYLPYECREAIVNYCSIEDPADFDYLEYIGDV